MNITRVNSLSAADSYHKTTAAQDSETAVDKSSFQQAMASYEEYAKDKIKNGDTKFQIGGSAMTNEEWTKLLSKVDKDLETMKDELEERLEKKAPYSYLADETGIINYQGTVFVCDDEHQALCLGDMSETDNVITIPLSGGGCLKVNRDNLEDLSNAIGMFSPEDINLIMRAIAQDHKVREVQAQIDEDENSIGDSTDPENITDEMLAQLVNEEQVS